MGSSNLLVPWPVEQVDITVVRLPWTQGLLIQSQPVFRVSAALSLDKDDVYCLEDRISPVLAKELKRLNEQWLFQGYETFLISIWNGDWSEEKGIRRARTEICGNMQVQLVQRPAVIDPEEHECVVGHASGLHLLAVLPGSAIAQLLEQMIADEDLIGNLFLELLIDGKVVFLEGAAKHAHFFNIFAGREYECAGLVVCELELASQTNISTESDEPTM